MCFLLILMWFLINDLTMYPGLKHFCFEQQILLSDKGVVLIPHATKLRVGNPAASCTPGIYRLLLYQTKDTRGQKMIIRTSSNNKHGTKEY